jgi:hypothetical protein
MQEPDLAHPKMIVELMDEDKKGWAKSGLSIKKK